MNGLNGLLVQYGLCVVESGVGDAGASGRKGEDGDEGGGFGDVLERFHSELLRLICIVLYEKMVATYHIPCIHE